MNLPEIAACRNNFGHRLCDSINSTVIRAPAGKIRIKTVSHHGDGRGFSFKHRYFRYHGLRLCQLIFSSVRHKNTACADGGIEHLDKALLRACVQIRQCVKPLLSDIADVSASSQCGIRGIRNIHINIRFLMSAVGVQERAGQVDDVFSSPVQDKSRLLRDDSHLHCFQVLLCRIGKELIRVFGAYHNSHTFLGLGDGELRSVKAGILLRYLVKVYRQTVGKLADGHRYAAGTEVVALFDDSGHLRASEHALKLPLRRRISFLYLRAAGLERLRGVDF